MPPNFQLEGIDCAHRIRAEHPGTGVVVLSAHDDEAYALALLGGGQSGLAYLLKDRVAQGDELARAITQVHEGGSLVDPTIAERLAGRKDAGEDDRVILDFMARGAGYAEMAEALGTTQEAIDRQVTAALRAPRVGRRSRRRGRGRRAQASALGRRGERDLRAHAARVRAPGARREDRLR